MFSGNEVSEEAGQVQKKSKIVCSISTRQQKKEKKNPLYFHLEYSCQQISSEYRNGSEKCVYYQGLALFAGLKFCMMCDEARDKQNFNCFYTAL